MRVSSVCLAAHLVVGQTANTGWGLFTTTHILKQAYIVEYRGEILDNRQCEARIFNDSNSLYHMALTSTLVRPPPPFPSLSRWMVTCSRA